MMQKNHWPLTDLSVSPIALGAMRFAGRQDDPTGPKVVKRVEELLAAALELGINFIDHADIYGGGQCEQAFAAALEKHPDWRDQFILQSKCGIKLGEGHRYNQSPDYILAAVDGILSRLNTDRIDCLLLHRPDPLMQPEQVASAFSQLQASGKVRYFGVSNFSASQMDFLQRSCSMPLVANQIQISLLHPWPLTEGVFVNRPEARVTGAEGLVHHCQSKQAQIQAWSPVAGGSLSQDASEIKDERQAAVCQAVSEMARQHSATPEAIGLAWLLRHPAAIVPIVGTTKPQRLKSMAQAAELPLSSDEWWTLFNASLGRRLP